MKNVKTFGYALVVLFMSINLVGCGDDKRENEDVALISIPFLDGSEIKVPEEIDTYATLAPSYTETLIDLGFENSIVTVDINSTYLSGYNNDVSVYDTGKLEPNHESLLENSPDVILIEAKEYNKIPSKDIEEIEENGSIFVVLPKVNNVTDVREELDFIVRLTNAEFGDRMLEDFDSKLAQILIWREEIIDYPVVFFQLKDIANVKTVGSETLIDQMISLAGGLNAFGNEYGEFYTSYEEIALKNPSYYFATANGESTQENQILNNKALSETKAIRNEEVYIFDEIQMLNPNYRCLDAINTMGGILHHDIFN